MTIFNIANNISEDYIFILDTNEVFYDKTSIPTGIFIYTNEWEEILTTDNSFDTQYTSIQNIIMNATPQLIDINDDFLELLIENNIYIGIKTETQENFPEIPTSQYFALIITNDLKACIPIKSLSFANTKIIDAENYTPNDNEYLSAKQVLNIIKQEIEKIHIFQVVSNLNQITNPQTNKIYFLTKVNDPSDSLNISFDLYAYNPDYTSNDNRFIKLDDITFDIRDYAPLIHQHGSISSDGKIGSTANKPLITGTDGVITAGDFGTSANTFASGNHSHGNITTDGKINGATDGDIVVTTAGGVINTANQILSTQLKNSVSLSNLNLGSNKNQSEINAKIDNYIGKLSSEKISKGNISGGTNLCIGDPLIENAGNGATSYTIANELFHNEKVYHIERMDNNDTGAGSSTIYYMIASNEFTCDDVFTLSFWAKGTSTNMTRFNVYFSEGIPVKRLSSNSMYSNSTGESNMGSEMTGFSLSTNWQQHFVTFQLGNTTNATIDSTIANTDKKIRINFGSNFDMYLSNIQLERGYNVTDYSRGYREIIDMIGNIEEDMLS